MAIDNVTFSQVTFQVEEGELFKDALPVGSITISPVQGYTLLATDFSLNGTPPSYIDNTVNPPTFTQDNNNVIFEFRFTNTASMPIPGASISIGVCLKGVAREISFTLNGEVNIVGDANTDPTGTTNYNYTLTAFENDNLQVWQVIAAAKNGYYFPSVPSILPSAQTDETPYTISTTETYDPVNTSELKSVTYTALYNFQPNGRYNLTSPNYDTFNIFANIAIPSVSQPQGITSYLINESAIAPQGTQRELHVYGAENYMSSVEISDDNGTSWTYLVEDLPMPAAQSYSTNIVFPSATNNTTWTIRLTDYNGSIINLGSGQDNPFTILQNGSADLPEALFSVTYGSTTVTSSPRIFTPNTTPASPEINYIDLVVSPSAGNAIEVVQIPTGTWSYQNGTEPNGTEFEITNVQITPVSTPTTGDVTITLTVEFDTYGSAGFTSNANIDLYIGEVPSCTTFEFDASLATADTTYEYAKCSDGSLLTNTVTAGDSISVCARTTPAPSVTSGDGVVTIQSDSECSVPWQPTTP